MIFLNVSVSKKVSMWSLLTACLALNNTDIPVITSSIQNAMPLSSAVFKSEHKNPVPQCPPRLYVQTINAVLWSRMPNSFLKVETARVNERHGWVVQCVEPLQMLAVHIPEENRYKLEHTCS